MLTQADPGANKQSHRWRVWSSFLLLWAVMNVVAIVITSNVHFASADRSSVDLVVCLLVNVILGSVVVASAARRRRNRLEADEDPLRVEMTLELAVEPDAALALVMSAMERLGLRVLTTDVERRNVLGKQGVTLRSWGEMVHVLVEPADTGSRLTCVSWPSWDWTAVDWGAGRRILQEFARELADPTPPHDSVDDYPAYDVGPF
jgi:hypothetical protein